MSGKMVLFDGMTVSICYERSFVAGRRQEMIKNRPLVSLFSDTNPRFLVFEYLHHIPDVLPMTKCILIDHCHSQDLQTIVVLWFDF